MKLFTRFSLSISALLIAVIMGMGAMSIYSEKRLLISEMKKHHTEVTARLAKVCEESLYQDELILFNYLKELENERGFDSAYFLDVNQNIRVHSDPSLIGKKAESIDERDLVKYTAPVFYGNVRAGEACLVLNKNVLTEFLQKTILSNFRRLFSIGIIALGCGFFGALVLTKMMVDPIQLVVRRMKDVGEGRREVFPAIARKDELGWMASELNNMVLRLKELDQLKNEFVSAVTHELRSPLTAIERFVSLMLKGTYGAINPEQQDTLITIKNNSIRLAQFVDEVLTTSKLESRRVDAYFEAFDVRGVVEEVRKLYLPMAEDKKLRFDLHMPRQKADVWADRTMVHHVVSNLVSNALKFTERGGITIGVKESGHKVEIQVTDTGPGIPEKDHEKIFEKFYRSLSTAHKTKGTGLGLFIVKSFIEVQKGSIRVLPQPVTEGTTIEITLPKPTGQQI